MIRPLYLTDLLLLFFFRGALPNEAGDRLGNRSLLSPDVLLAHWLPLRGRRHTWVLAEGGRILGIVSIKGCSGPAAWRVDHLQVGDEERCLALLERASAAAANRGVRKIFLRFPSTSPLMGGARRAGFSRYNKDYLYRYSGEGGQMAAESVPLLRPRSRGDEYGLFELYSACVPIQVRTAEGMTLKEWQETRDRGSWLEQRREFVLEKQGSLVGWLRVNASRGRGFFEILSHPAEQDGLEGIVNYGLMCLDGKSPIFCIASAFQGQLRQLLESLGFEEVEEYSTMVKEIALKVREPYLAPARA